MSYETQRDSRKGNSRVEHSFFHIGVNRTNAQKYGVREPHVQSNGPIPWVPLPDHRDPDFDRFTYGDPWGRLGNFKRDDIAWFLESGTVNHRDWGYYLVAYFLAEAVYRKKAGIWDTTPTPAQMARISYNQHELRADTDYAILLGDITKSRRVFERPLRITKAQDLLGEYKALLGMPANKRTIGYWFKKWFEERHTRSLLKKVI